MIYAWVLILAAGYPYGVSVSNIASHQECERLGKDASVASNLYPIMGKGFVCLRYQLAR